MIVWRVDHTRHMVGNKFNWIKQIKNPSKLILYENLWQLTRGFFFMSKSHQPPSQTSRPRHSGCYRDLSERFLLFQFTELDGIKLHGEVVFQFSPHKSSKIKIKNELRWLNGRSVIYYFETNFNWLKLSFISLSKYFKSPQIKIEMN